MQGISHVQRLYLSLLAGLFLIALVLWLPGRTEAQTSKSGSIGIEGTIPSAPPKQAASITFPRDGATITTLPVTVTGICPSGTIVRIFKNNAFSGSAECKNGSFSVLIDLFTGANELVARVYDSLDQQGPDSNIVRVTYPVGEASSSNRISLTSNYAKRGANPKDLLTWPISLSGGEAPYAVTVDWGDGKTPDVISQAVPGVFDIKHAYDTAGTYVVIVRATDKNGDLAFLQLVAVSNGQVTDEAADGGGGVKGAEKTKVLWLPVLFTVPFIGVSFWLGRRHELQTLRKKLDDSK